jgi:hypothetical protein
MGQIQPFTALDAATEAALRDSLVGREPGRGRSTRSGPRRPSSGFVSQPSWGCLESVTEFARGRSGSSKVLVMKDRPGHVKGFAQGKVVGYVSVEALAHDAAANLDPVTVTITSADPTAQVPAVATNRVSVIQESVREFLEQVGKPVSQRQILKGVPGASAAIKAALDQMTKDGTVTRSKRQRQGGGSGYQLAQPAVQQNAVEDEGDDAQAA